MGNEITTIERTEPKVWLPDESNDIGNNVSKLPGVEDQISAPDEKYGEDEVEAANILADLNDYQIAKFCCSQNGNQQMAEKAKARRLYSNIQDAPRYETQEHIGVIIKHPNPIQVAKYNIYPPPSITLSKPLPREVFVRVYLEAESKKGIITIDKGFLSGDVQNIRSGHNHLQFGGLLLNKMTPIKRVLGIKSNQKSETSFYLKFNIESTSIVIHSVRSNPFTLISNVNQVPAESKAFRPYTKTISTPTTARVDTAHITFQDYISIPATATTTTTTTAAGTTSTTTTTSVTTSSTTNTSMSTSTTCPVMTEQGDDGDGDGEMKEEKDVEGDNESAELWRVLKRAINSGNVEGAGTAAEELAMHNAKRQKTHA